MLRVGYILANRPFNVSDWSGELLRAMVVGTTTRRRRATPGRYVGLPEEEDDFDFAERYTVSKAEFESQVEEQARLNKAIAANLAEIELPRN